MSERFLFGAGASSFSIIWFFGLALSASLGSRLLGNPKAMRVISLISGLILIFLSIKLSGDVLDWVKKEPSTNKRSFDPPRGTSRMKHPLSI